MRITRINIVAIAATVLLSPAALRAQNGIVVVDFATGSPGRNYSLTQTGELRRGVTSTVKIIKSLLDLVPHDRITIFGGTLGSITQGRTSSGVGFVQMTVTVAGNKAIGSNVTLFVGDIDQYVFQAVHKGQITSISFSPNPTASQPGTPITATVQGEDLGTAPNIGPLGCHSITPGNGSNTSFTTTLARTNNCTNLGPFSFGVRSTANGDPNDYATSSGTKSFSFGPYAPPPPTGVVCASANVGEPVIVAPLNNQVIVFAPASNALQPIAVSWDADTRVTVPNNEFVYSRVTTTRQGLGPERMNRNVIGTQTSDVLRVPGSYTVTLRAFNCGQLGPSTTISFSLRFQ